MFTKASKKQSKLRMALSGASGSGKTFSALSIAKHLGGKIALIDTEHGSASKYADKFDFDVCEVTKDYNPKRLVEAIEEAAKSYDIVIVDSMTHFWNGDGGFLALVDAEVKRMQARGSKPDSFAAWKEVTPVYNRMIQAILNAPAHVFVTLRAKQEYSKEGGKVQKLGTAPEMRDNFQYEMDIEGLIDDKHNLVIGKTRCDELDGKVFSKAGVEVAKILNAWLSSGELVTPERVIDLVSDPVLTPVPPKDVSANEVLTGSLAQAMRAAADKASLKDVVQQATTAFKEKNITKEQFTDLGTVYNEVSKKVA
jgi:hypothetical protein